MMNDKQVLLAMYPTLTIFVGWSLWTLITRVTLPALQDGTVSKYLLGVGGTVVSLSLLLEVVLYGPGRWAPEWAWLGDIFVLAASAKVGLTLGSLMITASSVPPGQRPARLGRLCLAALGVWAAALLLAAEVAP